MAVTFCVFTRRDRKGGLKPGDWQRTVRIEYNWSDGTESGTDRIWELANDDHHP